MRKWLGMAVAGLVALACVASAQAETKYAVCVGINTYSLSGCSTLQGCVNDAAYFYTNLVTRGGWSTTNMTKLTNSGAKKNAIRQAISNYAAKAVSGDTFIYQHSSHGGQSSGKNVYLCAYDATYKDSDFASDLAQFAAGVKVLVVVDACHSGGLFKDGVPFSFDLAARVTEIMDGNRKEQLARGVRGVEQKLSSSEIGWVTAAEYTESSMDGGFYDSDAWLTDPSYEGKKWGGVFLGAFTWSWWNGTGDAKSGSGDNDGYADAYECWKEAYSICTNYGTFKSAVDSDYSSADNFTPQYTNINVIRSIELGWVGDQEPSGVRFAPIPAQTATVGQALNYTVVATNSDGSSGKITYSVTSSTAPSGSYSVNSTSGAFTFTPATDGTFTFDFVGTNSTAHTVGKVSMTVTASLAAPSGLANSGITDTSFTASWNAVAGATSYFLEVFAVDSDASAAAKAASDAFELVTSADELTAGEYLILAATNNRAMNNSFVNNSTGVFSYEDVTVENSAISTEDASIVWTLEGDASSCTLFNADAGKYANPSTARACGWSDTASGSWTLALDKGLVSVINAASTSWQLQYNFSSPRFAMYEGSGQDLRFFRRDGASGALFADDVGNVTSYTVTGLIPGDYQWRVRAIGNAKGPFSEFQDVTLNADPTAPPSIRPIADIDVTVGQPATATVAVSAPEEAPVTSLEITDGDPSATLQDGVFSFTPVYPNTYNFTITAINANGPATESFTVTATLADPAQPDTPATVGSDAFTAAWDPIPGAESYELDVVQGATSGGGGSGGGDSGAVVLSEDFSNVVSNSTSITDFSTVTTNAGWSGENAEPGNGMVKFGTSKKAGLFLSPAVAVSGKVTVTWTGKSWGSDNTIVNVGVSEDGGNTFTDTPVQLTDSFNEHSTTYNVTASSVIVRWQSSATSKQRFFISKLAVSSGSKSRDLSGTHVDGYPKNVGNVTSYIVSSLQPQTEYSFAIRAIAGDSASEWSPAATVTTTEGPAAPVWSDIPEQAAAVDYPYSIDLSAYVSGSPTPALSLVSGGAILTGTVLSFTPAAAQGYSFTVNASNDSGESATTFTVTATTHVPAKYALCVGINKYSLSGAGELTGCVNDSKYMAQNLVERGGWEADNVLRLNDSKASKAAIRAALADFASKTQAGDTFLYQHSSHGGNNGEDEYIESVFLCAADDYYEDTEVAEDLRAFPAGVKVIVIVDACHSGGLFQGDSGKARRAAANFNLAERVTAIMNADRTARKARGEDVSKTLSAAEIGWVTAANFDQESMDGGFYNSDEWLTNPSYGDDDYNQSTGTYPASYVIGGIFSAAGTWGWWNGTGDADPEVGDNDGYTDAYEFWKKGLEFCTNLDLFWEIDPDDEYYPYSFTPQCTNVAVLRSVELGWIEDPRPAAPANPKASDVTASSFTASWDASEGAASYNLYLQKKVEAEASTTSRDDGEYQIDESFEGGEIPADWTASSNVAIANGKGGDGTYCLAFKGAGATLVTPAVENPTGISFMYKRSNNPANWVLEIAVGPSAEGPWTPVGSVSDAATTWNTYESAISATGTQYIKFTDARSEGAHERYIDLVQVTGSAGTWEDVAGCAPASVAGLSKTVDGLDSDTDYRFWATAIDGEGVESADSDIVVLHTLAEDSAPVWSEIPEQSAVAGVMGDFDAADYVTASPAATITLVSVTAPEGVTIVEDEDYQFEDGYLVFTPPAEGSYVFEFQADNDLGYDTATLTVVASGAPVTVPVLTLGNATASSFDASWTACSGASSYQFQVATDDQFTSGSAGGTFTLVTTAAGLTAGEYVILAEDSNDAMNNTYSTSSAKYLSGTEVTVTGSTVSTEDATIIWTLAGTASSCTLFNGNAGKYVNPAASKSLGWSDTASGSWTLSVDAEGIVTAANADDTSWMLQYNYNNGNPRFMCYSSNMKKLRFFRRSAKSAKDGGSLVLDETTSGLTYTASGLEPQTTYYARVRMADGDWSGVEDIDTSAIGPVAPAWSAIPAQSTYAGATFQLDLSSYLTGYPEPTVTADVGTVTGLNYVYAPEAAGNVTVTLTASNDSGTVQTTFVLAVAEAPVGGTHYAVLVGCNNYASAYGASDLNGAVPDANHVYDLITTRGDWEAANVTKLLNSSAKHDAIRAAVSNAAASAVAGDTFLYFQSSHGGNRSYTFVTNAAPYNDYATIVYGLDPDGVDNFICSYNADYTAAEMAADLSAFDPGVKVVVMLDTCHSAGMFKYDASRGIRRDADGASFHSASPALFAEAVDAQLGAIRRARGIRAASNVGFVTAANFDEYSWDNSAGDGGEFTTAFIHGVTNGICDGADYGDQDGWATFYEGWNYAKGIAVGASVGTEFDGDLTAVDSNGYAVVDNSDYTEAPYYEPAAYYDYYFTHAQITNEAVLRAVRVGYAGNPTLAAPVANAAANVTDSSFTASWSAVADATGYRLQVATDESFSTGAVSDTLAATNLAATGTSYTDFSGVEGASGAVYAGKTAKNSGAIQLNDSKSAGIWTTASGGNVSRVAVVWNTSPASGRSVKVYGSATPLASYSAASAATLIGTITESAPSLDISDSYAYVGVLPSGGAIYLDSVTIDWNAENSESSIVIDENVGNVTSIQVTELEAATDYYYRVQALGGPVDSDFSNVIALTTESGTPAAPEWLDLPAQTATVGLEFGLDLSSYVTGSPFPAIYVEGVEAVGGDWTFTPVAAGTFDFALLASNEVGTASSTLTVEVSDAPPAPVTVPVLTLSNPTTTTFDAAWTACDGATSYQFQVATDDQFTTGGGGEAILNEYFSGFTATNSNLDVSNQLDDYTAVSGWSGSKIYADAGRIKLGSGSGQGWIATPALNIPVAAVLTFSAAQYNKDTGTISANISTDDGETWTALANAFTLTTNASTFTVEFAEPFVNAKIQFIASVNRFYLDDVVISGAGGGETSVILDTTTSDLSCTVEGLTPETTYYARVRMADGDWSEVKSITTASGGSGGVVAVTGLAVEGNNLKLTLAGEATAVYGATELDENGGWMWEAIDVVIEGDTVTLPMDEPKMIYKVE